MAEKIIQLKEVTKQYGKAIVLDHVSVDFEGGKIHGIVGRNGSGKTMLMKCICGFVRASAGKVLVNGKEVGKEIEIPEDLGIIIETPGFIPMYSGLKNLRLLASVKKKIGVNEIKGYMEKIGLDPKDRKPVGKYSLGMRQKLGIVQAIMEPPKILILDEPMNGLDNHSVTLVRDMLKELARSGTTIVLASHNSEDIDDLCDTVIRMDHGEIIAYEET